MYTSSDSHAKRPMASPRLAAGRHAARGLERHATRTPTKERIAMKVTPKPKPDGFFLGQFSKTQIETREALFDGRAQSAGQMFPNPSLRRLGHGQKGRLQTLRGQLQGVSKDACQRLLDLEPVAVVGITRPVPGVKFVEPGYRRIGHQQGQQEDSRA
jgi:hypothetical protein